MTPAATRMRNRLLTHGAPEPPKTGTVPDGVPLVRPSPYAYGATPIIPLTYTWSPRRTRSYPASGPPSDREPAASDAHNPCAPALISVPPKSTIRTDPASPGTTAQFTPSWRHSRLTLLTLARK